MPPCFRRVRHIKVSGRITTIAIVRTGHSIGGPRSNDSSQNLELMCPQRHETLQCEIGAPDKSRTCDPAFGDRLFNCKYLNYLSAKWLDARCTFSTLHDDAPRSHTILTQQTNFTEAGSLHRCPLNRTAEPTCQRLSREPRASSRWTARCSRALAWIDLCSPGVGIRSPRQRQPCRQA